MKNYIESFQQEDYNVPGMKNKSVMESPIIVFTKNFFYFRRRREHGSFE